MLTSMFMTLVQVLFQISSGWGAVRHHRGAGHDRITLADNLCGNILLFASWAVCW